jgi:ATP-dependent DNA helicase RecG
MLAVIDDVDVIEAAREGATALVAADPELTGHPDLLSALDSLVDASREGYLEKG